MEGAYPKKRKEGVQGGARGPVIFCLHESLNKLAFTVQAFYEDGELIGVVAGRDGFINEWVRADSLDLTPDHKV